MLRAFGHLVATCWVLLAQIWPVSNLSQQHPTCCNTSQHGGQTHATCCAQQCCDMLRWHVAIVWPGINAHLATLLQRVATCWVFKMPRRSIAAQNLSKRLQHHAASTNAAWKLLPVSNLKRWPNDSNLSSMLREFGHLVATCCAMLRSFGWCWPKF